LWHTGGVRFFNTTGPVQQERHYAVPPLSRLNLYEVLGLVRTARYFVLHAPRQTGKTSALLALQNLLNGGTEGDYRCLYINVEAGQAAREDTARAMRAILGEVALRARLVLQDRMVDEVWPEALDRVGTGAWNTPSGRGWNRRRPTWIAAAGRRATW